MDTLFNKNAYIPQFFLRDPLTKFMRQIGKSNASHITKVVIEGYFKTAKSNSDNDDGRPLGIGRFLPILTTVLQNACPELREITLHQGDSSNCDLWDDDLNRQLGLTDEERVDSIVGNVVNALPSLQKLQLGNWIMVPDAKLIRAWGHAYRWEKVVEDRFRKGKQLQLQREHKENMKQAARGSGQHIWNDNKTGSRGDPLTPQRNDFPSLVDKALSAAEAGGSKRGKKFSKGGKRGSAGFSAQQ